MPTSTKSTGIPNPDSITVTITRTVQITQYHPVDVTITETYSVPEGADMDTLRRALTRKIGSAVADTMDREIKRYEPSE